jgi:hypothetical protein
LTVADVPRLSEARGPIVERLDDGRYQVTLVYGGRGERGALYSRLAQSFALEGMPMERVPEPPSGTSRSGRRSPNLRVTYMFLADQPLWLSQPG